MVKSIKKYEFLKRIEPYRSFMKGNGRMIAEKAEIDYHRYSNAIKGLLDDSELFNKILNAVKSSFEEVVAKVSNQGEAV